MQGLSWVGFGACQCIRLHDSAEVSIEERAKTVKFNEETRGLCVSDEISDRARIASMDNGNESPARDLGEQPIARLLATLCLSAHDLVAASREQLTHKMVRRACKGRRLTPQVQQKLLNALNARTAGSYTLADLFDYGDERPRPPVAGAEPAP